MLSRRDRVLAWTMPIVLVVVALHQVYLGTTRDLTPWKGGGFGMFASVDRSTWRAMQAVFVTDEGEIPFAVHDLSDGARREHKVFTNARALLDERRGDALIDVVSASEWVIDAGVAEYEGRLDADTAGPLVHHGEPGDADVVEVSAIRVEVWRATYDRQTRTFVPELAGRHERSLWSGP